MPQAQWTTGTVPVQDLTSDPLDFAAGVQPKTPVEELVAMMEKEYYLETTCGLHCPLRAKDEVVCALCPVSHAGDMDHDLALLCETSARIERLRTSIYVTEGQAWH